MSLVFLLEVTMLAPETVLNERYRITYLVAERPDMILYRAIDTTQSLRVLVADLPQPHESAIQDVQALAGQLLGFTAPGLLTLRDHFAQGLNYYLIADDPGGQDLDRAARDRGGPLPETEVLTNVERLLTTLDMLHSNAPPLLLGDLCGSDLWSSPDGGLFLAPFALVRHIGSEQSPYSAPELRNPEAEPTTAADVYAIGAVLYQLLTGWAPPTANQRQAATPLNSPRVLNARVSALAEQLVLRSLELKPVNRYQQAREMRSALQTVHLMAGRSLGAAAPIDPSQPASAQPGMVPPIHQPPAPPPAPPSGYGPPPPAPPPAPAAYGAQPTQPPYGGQPALPPYGGQPQPAYASYGPPAAAAPPARGPQISNGCLVAIVAILALLALGICVVGFWISFMIYSQGASPGLPGGPVTMATAAPANPGGQVGESSQPNPATTALIAAGAPFTRTAQLNDAAVGAALYAPDASLIAVGLGTTVELRDGATLEPIRRLEDHGGEISALAFSPDSGVLAVGTQDDPSIRIWDLRSGRELRRLEGHTGWIRSLAFSPDGSLLASGSTDQQIVLWDAATGQEVRRLSGHRDFLGNLSFSPDGTRLASASRDGTARLWDVASGTERSGFSYTAPINPQNGAPFWLTGISFSPDGNLLAVGSVSGSVYLLNPDTGQLQRELQGHQGWVVIRGVSFSPDGSLLASASLDGTVRLWSPRTGTERTVLSQAGLRLLGLSWKADGNSLAVSSDTAGSLAVWNVSRREISQSVNLAQGALTALAYSDTGASLVTGGVNGSVKVYRLNDGTQIPLAGGAPSGQYVAFLNDNQLVAISDRGAVVQISLNGGSSGQSYDGLAGVALTLDVTRDRRLVAAGNERGDVLIWDAVSREVRQTLRGMGGPVGALAFNRDGSQIAVAINEPVERPSVIVWEVRSGTRRSTFNDHQGSITALRMPAGQDVVATASSDGSLRIWQAATGDEVRTQAVPVDQGWYSAIAFSPDGQLMATGTLAGQVELWVAADGRRLSGIDLGDAGSILGLTFRPDGEQIAVATRDGGAILLDAVR
ncbi:MAG: serine/threonine protein kinase [Oscillochloridaceae bacterium umkhey_bin13]